ncbi:MAG TPA: hypothetical protein VHM19_05670 [Polyangiales bacterium]|nr:hypothetical protein [Polyangiales bacterium]
MSHLIALVVACCTCAHARAQDVPPSAEAGAAELHAQALDAYQALDFGRAALKLQLALQLLAAPHGNAELRARLEATLAVVYQTGTLDAAAAELQMQNAVCDDPSVAIDPLLASPDVVALLDRARRFAPVRCTPARAPAPSRTAFQDSELPPSLAHREPPPARAAPMHVRLALGAALAAGWLHAGLPTDRAEADGTCCALQLERSGLAPLLSVHAAAGLTPSSARACVWRSTLPSRS